MSYISNDYSNNTFTYIYIFNKKKESFTGELNVLQYKEQNPNFKQKLLENPMKLTKKLFKTSSSIRKK